MFELTEEEFNFCEEQEKQRHDDVHDCEFRHYGTGEKGMTFDELHEKVRKAFMELQCNGLERVGYSVQIELSINSYRELLNDYRGRIAIKTEIDGLKECIHRGTIYGTPFVLTQDTDRVLISKEIADK